MNHNPHDNKIKQAFEEREMQPSASLWDRIELELDTPIAVKEPTVKKRPVFWSVAAAIVMLLGIGFVWNFDQVADTPELTQVPVQTAPLASPVQTPSNVGQTPIAAQMVATAHKPVARPTQTVSPEKMWIEPIGTTPADKLPAEYAANDEQLMQLAVQFENEKSVQVNAKKLLQAVDKKPVAPETHRDQLFRRIGHTYNQVHYAISNRNYENE